LGDKRHQKEKYVLTDFKVFKIAKEYLEESNSPAIAGKKKLSRKSKFEVPVEKTIGEVFSYESNLVKVECNFTSVKDMYMQQRPQGEQLTDNSFNNLKKRSAINKS